MKNSKTSYCLPSDITPAEFLAEYWQKKPLLIKQGLPQLINMFEPDDILGLAMDEEVSARLIKQKSDNSFEKKDLNKNFTENQHPFKWMLKKSPLSEKDFDELPEQWTVLVQNMEQWSPELGNLWRAFDFIPQWQRDDIMVSFAPVGGSVGKHYDDYDVFLAQGYGHRRWQLGKYCDETTEFLPNQPIRIFDDMGDIIFDEVLEPGDVIYVPPKLSHYGIAQDDCLTFSFGFRRPNIMQIFDSLTDVVASEASLFIPLLLEQDIQPSGELTKKSIQHIKSQLIEMLNTSLGEELISQAISESVSKRQYDILIPEDTLTIDEVRQYLHDGATLQIDYSSRLIYRETENGLAIYANGQPITGINILESELLSRMANGEKLNYFDVSNLDYESIMEWLENGWVWLDFPM